MMARLPPIDQVSNLSRTDRTQILDLLFERCQQLHALSLEALVQERFVSYRELVRFVGRQLEVLLQSPLESDREQLEKILSSHSRLGEKKVDSEQSRAEQAQLQQSTDEELTKLRDLNRRYEATFPGLRYVVFVNGRDRNTIMADMKRRIENENPKEEREDAVQAMCDIAEDRAKKLQAV